MKLYDWLLTIFIIMGFVGSMSFQSMSVSLDAIKDEWPQHRCNPIFMPFASQFGEDTMTNFKGCIQGYVKDIMGYVLKPIEYSLSLIGTLGGNFEKSLNGVRKMITKIRGLAKSLFGQIYGVFLNILIEFQQMIIAIKDMMGKMMGVMTTFLFMLDGAVKTMKSVWKGPPGQLLRGLCFLPSTKIRLQDNRLVEIQDIKHGDILKHGEVVYATMQIKNTSGKTQEYLSELYELDNSEEQDARIIVSASHLVKHKGTFIQVYKHPNATKLDANSDTLICLITNTHEIPIGEYIFGDWEDNGLLPCELHHDEKIKIG